MNAISLLTWTDGVLQYDVLQGAIPILVADAVEVGTHVCALF
jgi:hypothetical protein